VVVGEEIGMVRGLGGGGGIGGGSVVIRTWLASCVNIARIGSVICVRHSLICNYISMYGLLINYNFK
jgi:hypothetical protein